jgi:hypothetical protein
MQEPNQILMDVLLLNNVRAHKSCKVTRLVIVDVIGFSNELCSAIWISNPAVCPLFRRTFKFTFYRRGQRNGQHIIKILDFLFLHKIYSEITLW